MTVTINMNSKINLLIKDFNDKIGIQWTEQDKLEFAEMVVQNCIQYLNDEVYRLPKTKNALPEWDEEFRSHIDICIDKCNDNIQEITELFRGES